jgi:hypothetical protein
VAPRATLSFCITTRGPADRARALLDLLRPYVDEIVLAVDRQGGLEALDACADLADRRLVYELERSPVWLAGWIMHQCRGDWILRLDDDEVPSVALLEALPELVSDRYPTVHRLDRRWLYQTPDRYITSFPWSLEYQARLVRNVPSLWRFEGRLHMGGEWLGEVRMTDLAMYHLVLLTSSIHERRAKRDRYERLVPGLAIEEFPMEAMYLPEELEAIDTDLVPADDRPLIGAMLAPKSAPPTQSAGAPVEEATREEIAIYNRERRFSEGGYEAAIEFVAPRREFPPGVLRHLELVVENRGDELWRPADGRPPEIMLGWRWRELRSDRPLRGEGRAPFSETVRPGQRTRFHIVVRTPSVPGTYALETDVVHEHVRWFGCGAELPVVIDRAASDGNAGTSTPSQGVRKRLRRAENPARKLGRLTRRAVSRWRSAGRGRGG